MPAVVVPFGHDREDNGLRVQALRAGKLVHRTKVKFRLARAPAEILDDGIRQSAVVLGSRIREESDGASRVAEIIESRINA